MSGSVSWQGGRVHHYIYNADGEPVPEPNMNAYMAFVKEHRIQKKDFLADGTEISTVFLGIDHQYGDGPPLVFETMVFASADSGIEQDCRRYTTRDEAMAGHEDMRVKYLASKGVC